MPRRASLRRVGGEKSVPPEQVRALMTEYDLSPAQLAQIAGVGVQRLPKGGFTSSTVKRWLNHGMPKNIYGFVRGKLWLVEQGGATLEEISNMSLVELLERAWPRSIKVTRRR